jgi:hypothetical protein
MNRRAKACFAAGPVIFGGNTGGCAVQAKERHCLSPGDSCDIYCINYFLRISHSC